MNKDPYRLVSLELENLETGIIETISMAKFNFSKITTSDQELLIISRSFYGHLEDEVNHILKTRDARVLFVTKEDDYFRAFVVISKNG